MSFIDLRKGLIFKVAVLGFLLTLVGAFAGTLAGVLTETALQAAEPQKRPHETTKKKTSSTKKFFKSLSDQATYLQEKREMALERRKQKARDISRKVQPKREYKLPSQFWGDLLFFQGYKIQENVFTHHCRIIDPDGRSVYTGDEKSCRKNITKIQIQKRLPGMSGKCVILIHGMGCSAAVFKTQQRAFQKLGYTVVPFEYPSSRIKIEKSSRYLKQVIDSLDGITEINIVAHSMGGLIFRAWASKNKDARLKRMVMLGTPNHGASLAHRFKDVTLFRIFLGPAGQQMAMLTKKDVGFIAKLPKPPMEFAIIAGGRNDNKGYSKLIPGDDDGTVSVNSTQLSGATDFLTVGCHHMFLTGNPAVVESCLRFIQNGYLQKTAITHPIR